MPSARALASLALAVACTPACAFLADRGRDAARIVEADGGLTMGGGFHVGAAYVAEAGFGWYSGMRWGLREGSFVAVDEERAEFGVPIVYLHQVSQRVESGTMPGRATVGILDKGYERFPLQWFTGQLTDRDPMDLHIGLNVAYVGFNVMVRPYAFLDFVSGWFGFDLRDNDVGEHKAEDFLDDLKSPDALVRRSAVERIQIITGRNWPDYQTPPKRELFGIEEKRALREIDDDVRPSGPERSRAVTQPSAEQWLPPSPWDGMGLPEASPPASRPANADQ